MNKHQIKARPRHRRRKAVVLTDEERAEIRERYQKGVKGHGYLALAKVFGVHASTILYVVRGDSRGDV